MAFVTCEQFKTSQEAQDNAAMKAESSLLDGSVSNGTTSASNSAEGKGGTITVDKIIQALTGKLKVAVKDDSGILGDGTTSNPLRLNSTLSECVDVTNGNLNTCSGGLGKLGITCFYLKISRSEKKFTVGVPYTMQNTGVNYAKAATKLSDWGIEVDGTLESGADMSGYQIATPTGVIQFIYDDYHVDSQNLTSIATVSGYVRKYNAGMSSNGSLNKTSLNDVVTTETGEWRGWWRITNLPINATDIVALTTQMANVSEALATLTNAFSNAGILTSSGVDLSALLSKESGNLLQYYDDGLYYGIEAPADTRNLYVSPSTGNDNNEGTKSKPLATIKEAFKRNNVGTKFTIHLAENEMHEWRSSWGKMDGKFASFYPYGEQFDYAKENNIVGTVAYLRSQQIKRPVIVFIPDATSKQHSGLKSVATVMGSNGGYSTAVSFNAINLRCTSTSDYEIYSLARAFFGSRSHAVVLEFTGCDIDLGDTAYLVNSGAASSVTLDNTWISDSGKFIILQENGTVSLTVRTIALSEGSLMNGSTVLTAHRETPSTSIGSRIENLRGVQTANVITNVALGV